MFNNQVNTACINKVFISATMGQMKHMNEQMARIYEAARASGKLASGAEQASLARLLNVAQQNVNNWESRGPSKEGVLAAQHALGVNATWVLSGNGPMFVAGAAGPADQIEFARWPFLRLPPLRYQHLSENQKNAIEDAVIRLVDAFLGPSSDERGEFVSRRA